MPAKSTSKPAPSLRGAMWLYCLVLLGTALIVIPLAFNIDIVFLRLVATLTITAGFTVMAIYFSHARPAVIFGQRPTLINLILSLLAGFAIWAPAAWIMFGVYTWLNDAIGPIPSPIPSGASPAAILVQTGIIMPLAQGALFWGFIQRAAQSLGKARGAILAAVLYALYGLLTSDLRFASVPGLLLVGLLAAFITACTDSAWCGTAVITAYGISWPLLQSTLVAYLGEPIGNPLSVRWLLIVVVTGFIAFILFQIIRLRTPVNTEMTSTRPAPNGLWWIPLVLSIAVFLLGTYSEFTLRESSGRSAQRAIVTPRSGAPPVAIPPTPTRVR